MSGLDMLVQTVQLDTSMIVYVDVFLLRDGEVLVVMQPFGVANRLSQLQLTTQFACSPVHRRNMTLSSRKQQVSAIPRIVCTIRSHVLQLQLEALLGCLDANILFDLILTDLVRPLQLPFRLDESGLILEQDLRILGLQRRIFVLGLDRLETVAQFPIPNALRMHSFSSAISLLCFSQSLLCSASSGVVLFLGRASDGRGSCSRRHLRGLIAGRKVVWPSIADDLQREKKKENTDIKEL